jgi:hypothetical protein
MDALVQRRIADHLKRKERVPYHTKKLLDYATLA